MKETNNNNLYLSEDLFFLLENGKVLVWNYKSHEQFILETEYFSELLSIAKTGKPLNSEIADQLLEAKLITNKAHINPNWGWDVLSKIFHIGTQNVDSKNIAEDP